MNDVIYARVSTKDQSEAEQIPSIKKTFGLGDDVLVFREEVSAWSIDKVEKRFELQALIKAIKSKTVSRLFIWHIDRLYRNRKKMREFMDMCEFYGVSVYSEQQSWLNDFQDLKAKFPDNFRFLIDNIYNLMLDVYAQTAEDESKTKSERVRLKITQDSEGVTRSTSGKKWGRRSVPQRVTDEVLEYHSQGQSMRWISERVYRIDKNNNKKYISVGLVHKIITNAGVEEL